jgi:hypothetical protein
MLAVFVDGVENNKCKGDGEIFAGFIIYKMGTRHGADKESSYLVTSLTSLLPAGGLQS